MILIKLFFINRISQKHNAEIHHVKTEDNVKHLFVPPGLFSLTFSMSYSSDYLLRHQVHRIHQPVSFFKGEVGGSILNVMLSGEIFEFLLTSNPILPERGLEVPPLTPPPHPPTHPSARVYNAT